MTTKAERTESNIASACEAMLWAVEHFEAMDRANAKIHCAPVRYSPITFRLARALTPFIHPDAFTTPLADVLAHDGAYEEDKGR